MAPPYLCLYALVPLLLYTPRALGGFFAGEEETISVTRYASGNYLIPKSSSTRTLASPLTMKDTPIPRLTTNRHRMNRRASKLKNFPSAAALKVSNFATLTETPGYSLRFPGIDHYQQRTAGTGYYNNTQGSIEPPDMALGVGSGYVVQVSG
eukprot:TRINITY_DN3017_c0_g1_i1.p2 TRINITY_DN3017_c0_g1~~TRINITY_DN3017_c0_g1_i1.p2  ORF type:complete len:152 (+),score=8.88 TRINITY_DN3017_c0_g1_i1:236-691(+)